MLAILPLLSSLSLAFTPTHQYQQPASATLCMARGRGSFQKEFEDSSSSSSSTSSSGVTLGGNWLNTKKSIKELPEEEGKVRRKATNLSRLISFLCLW
jgi:hypothetical protein